MEAAIYTLPQDKYDLLVGASAAKRRCASMSRLAQREETSLNVSPATIECTGYVFVVDDTSDSFVVTIWRTIYASIPLNPDSARHHVCVQFRKLTISTTPRRSQHSYFPRGSPHNGGRHHVCCRTKPLVPCNWCILSTRSRKRSRILSMIAHLLFPPTLLQPYFVSN